MGTKDDCFKWSKTQSDAFVEKIWPIINLVKISPLALYFSSLRLGLAALDAMSENITGGEEFAALVQKARGALIDSAKALGIEITLQEVSGGEQWTATDERPGGGGKTQA